ncbi:hypothetical protein [Mangrovimonas sp. YM274]|uniref:hypothetical protein n=1 Tax=Mangrovimonas sp. YM274 TaxID=3070660 RepID=UPI0027DC9877|nr:hypothetical protein [Mangrovimonas sp. YM274]WMI69924.1 hypothetical protein RBH95_06135 [Mangrovimonas sp. YM274]
MKRKQLLMLFTCVSAFLGCSNDNDSENNQNSNFDSSDYYYFISGKINGEPFLYGQSMDDNTLKYQEVSEIPLEAATCAYGIDPKLSYSTAMFPNFDNEDTDPQMGISFIRFYQCSNPQTSTEVFNDLFAIGNYEYSENDLSSGTMMQIGVDYLPIAMGDVHYESYGEIDPNNTFSITSTEAQNQYLLGTLVSQKQLVEGEFSAKLYNTEDSSDFIEITEGRFKLSVTK